MLPKIEHTNFDIVIPSLGKKVKFRPFTVKEEKIILTASSSKNAKEIASNIYSIINNCCLEELDVHELTSYDLEYIFTILRAHSVGNKIPVSKEIDGKEYKGEVDLLKARVVMPKNMKEKVQVSDKVGIVLKTPPLEALVDLEGKNEEEFIFDIVARSIHTVYDEDKVYVRGKDFDDNESEEFLKELPTKAFHDLLEYFNNLPTVQVDVDLISKDGDKKKITIKGMQNFFELL